MVGKGKKIGNGKCAACRHPERPRAEFLIAGGASVQSVATKFAINYDSLYRHWHHHVPPERKAALLAGPLRLSEVMERAAEEGASVLDHLCALRAVLYKQLDAASEAGDRQSVATLSGRIIEVLRELGRANGELIRNGGVTLNQTNMLVMSPAFSRLEAELLRVLARHPEARLDVIKAFRAVESAAMAPAIADAHMIEGRADAA